MLASFTVISRASLGLDADQRCDGVERVEEEVGIDLALQGVEPRFEQQMFLLFELHLDAEGVPDFQSDADDDGRAEPDQHLHPELGCDQGKQLVGKHAGQLIAACFGGDDEDRASGTGGRRAGGAGCGGPSGRG